MCKQMTDWHRDITLADIAQANIKRTGLPTRGDFWMPQADGSYVKWDMITGEVSTCK